MAANIKNNVSLVVLDCSRGNRRLDQRQSHPTALTHIKDESTILDWTKHFINVNGIHHVTYIGGYQIQKVMENYSDFHFIYHKFWESTGEIRGLDLLPEDDDKDLIILRASSIIVPEALTALTIETNKICIGNNTDLETGDNFSGVLYIPQTLRNAFQKQITKISSKGSSYNLEDLLHTLPETLPCYTKSLNSLVAPIDSPIDLSRTIFQGKAQTLEQVGPLLKSSSVLKQYRFSHKTWIDHPQKVILNILTDFPGKSVIIRSTSQSEDTLMNSNAGIFKTVLNIPSDNSLLLKNAIEEVFASYAITDLIKPSDEIFIQEFQSNLSSSGVIFTRDLESSAPYILINIDRTSGKSDTVTAGTAGEIETIFISKNKLHTQTDFQDLEINACVALISELEYLTNMTDLDIEFGIDINNTMYLFQVRPISTKARKYILQDSDLFDQIANIQEFINALPIINHETLGKHALLGAMTDWNPIEMLGATPRPLALSLYQKLIGRQAWSMAREQLGYQKVGKNQLIHSLGGIPYVNIQLSLNSFLPNGIDRDTGEKWINHCLDKLQKNPELHDKVEFEITPTCMDLNFDKYLEELTSLNLTKLQIANFKISMQKLTNNILAEKVINLNEELSALKVLEHKLEPWGTLHPHTIPELSAKITHLTTICEEMGILPFAKLARCAFISISILNSLVELKIITDAELSEIYKNIPTVATDLTVHMGLYQSGKLTLQQFLKQYGHLRPSSYDITSPNYANGHEQYFKTGSAPQLEQKYNSADKCNAILSSHSKKIDERLLESGLTINTDTLIKFIIKSIQGREQAKFEFMKIVDNILESTTKLGHLLDLDRDQMSFLNIEELERLSSESASPAIKSELLRITEHNEKKWNLTCHTKLPHLITPKTDIGYFEYSKTAPNFISNSRIISNSLYLENNQVESQLSGKIILISSADPGYDWIFGHGITGLITEYGGAASHMSIRAAEFGIPAAIGCGKLLFDKLKNQSVIELDCLNKVLRGISC